MRTDTRDLVSATKAARDFATITNQAHDGRRFVVLKNNEPCVAIVPMSEIDALDSIQEREENIRLLAVALTRKATDSGVRHSLEDVAAEFGIDLDD